MIDKVKTSSEDQELLINYAPYMGDCCEIYTNIPHMMRYLEKMLDKHPEHYQLIKDDKYGMTVKCPLKLVKPRAPRVLSSETREKFITQLAMAREFRE